MYKILVSPVFVGLVILLLGQLWLWKKTARATRLVVGLMLLVTIGIGVLSVPVTTNWLALTLERPYLTVDAKDLRQPDIVTVLSGGYIRGPQPEQDELGGATYARAVTGVHYFKSSQARLLVMQGALPGKNAGRMVERMQNLAIELGVSPQKVQVEPHSRNTFAHPGELMKIQGVSTSDTIGVVTSAWHLSRAMAEFGQYFEHVVPLPSHFISGQLRGDFTDWLPQEASLEDSTLVVDEYIGRVWYWLKHTLS